MSLWRLPCRHGEVSEMFGYMYNEPHHEKTFMSYANNKCADQTSHPRSLISTFIVRCLDSLKLTYRCYIRNSKIQASLCSWAGQFKSYLEWSKIQKTGVLVTWLMFLQIQLRHGVDNRREQPCPVCHSNGCHAVCLLSGCLLLQVWQSDRLCWRNQLCYSGSTHISYGSGTVKISNYPKIWTIWFLIINV